MAAGALPGTRHAPSARWGRALAPYLLILPGGAWLALFFLFPILTLGMTSLMSGDFISGFQFTWNFANYTFGLDLYRDQYVHSIEYGASATLIAFLLAYPAAYWIAFHAGPRKSAYLLAILLPFFVSFVLRTLSWETLMGDDGILIGTLKSWHLVPADFRVLATPVAVTFGLAYTFFPYMLLPIYASLEKIDRRLVEAAEDLYSTPVEAFRKVVLPLSLPGVFAGSLLTFIPAMGDFINAQLLGSPNQQMIGTVIQNQFLEVRDYPLAASLSFVLMAVITLGVLAYARVLGTEDLA